MVIRAKQSSAAQRTVCATKQCNRILGLQRIADALIADGYTTLDAQAKALGVQRSTAWTIVRVKHKLGRLSEKTRRRILANPELPSRVRVVFQEYLSEKTGDRHSPYSDVQPRLRH